MVIVNKRLLKKLSSFLFGFVTLLCILFSIPAQGICPVDASFISSANAIPVGFSIAFTNTSTSASSYIWQKDGTTFSTNTSTSYTFTVVGDYTISLIATNGMCSDTSNVIIDVTIGGWVQRAGYEGEGKDGAVSFSIDNKGYIGTGDAGGYVVKRDFWEFDPVTNVWTQKADFGGVGRKNAIGFAIGSKGYIGTGSINTTTFLNDFWEYDPVTNSWSKKADFGGAARSNSVAFAIGSKGYVGTGSSFISGPGFTFYKDFWEYDQAGDSWIQKTDFAGTARDGSVSFSIGTKGYIGTGLSVSSFVGTWYKDFWEWDQITNTWIQIADLGTSGRDGAVGFSMNGKGYVATGVGQNDFWEYDTLSNAWLQKNIVGPLGRTNGTGFSIGNKGYIGLGSGMNDFWEYNPNNCGVSAFYSTSFNTIGIGNPLSLIGNFMHATGYSIWQVDGVTFAQTPISYNYSYASYTFNSPGDYIISVIASNGTCSDTMKRPIHVVCSGVLTEKTPLLGSHRVGAAGFSIGNKGYVGTGYYYSSSPYQYYYLKDFWEFDPIANVWTQKADFEGTARYEAVGFSIGAKGYIGTGNTSTISYSPVYTKDFWEYDPISNIWVQKSDFGGVARASAVGFSINAKGYIGTGINGTLKRDFWEYDPSLDTWVQKANFGGIARQRAMGFNLSDKGYIGMGTDGVSSFGNLIDFWEYNSLNDSWIRRKDPPLSAYDAIGFSINDKGYVCGGNNGTILNNFYEYDPNNFKWIPKAVTISINPFIQNGLAFAINNCGYIGTGWGGNQPGKKFWQFNPDSCGIINVLPSAIISPSIPQTICMGDSLLLNAKAESGISYQWQLDGIDISNAISPVYVAKLGGNYTIKTINSFTTNISSPLVVTLRTVPTVIVNPLNAAIICQGTSLVLTATDNGQNPNYQWKKNNANISGATSSSYTVTQNGSYSVYVFNSCGANLSSSVNIGVISSPTASISGNLTTCSGTSTSLTASGGNTYVWSTGATNASINISTAGTVSVIATDMNGCSDSKSVTIAVNPLPIITISGNLTICSGIATTLTAKGGNTYFWSTGTTTQIINVLTASTLTVTGIDVNGCSGSTTATVIQNDNPIVSISGNNTVCNGGSITLSGSGTNDYLWTSNVTLTNNSGTNVTANNITVNATFTLTGIDANGCIGTATKIITVVICTGIDESFINNSLNIFPNPANSNVTISFTLNSLSNVIVRVTNIESGVIYTENKSQCIGEYRTNIDVGKQSKGIYLLNLITDRGSTSRQLIVE